jgi:hypothetical protein
MTAPLPPPACRAGRDRRIASRVNAQKGIVNLILGQRNGLASSTQEETL